MLSSVIVAMAFLSAEPIECDLLVVGGGESGVAAAVQAARQGVRRIVLVNDGHWLGGQFTSEAIGAVDEWTKYRDGRAPFPRSGMFLEIMTAIEADMQRKYGTPRPGNCFCAWTTCEPRDTERLFRKLIHPYLKAQGGPIELFEDLEPARVAVENATVVGVDFAPAGDDDSAAALRVTARLTIDASDWGDVVRLSGARYFSGPDLKSRFQEPSAPETYDQVERTEVNPITYCLVLRESTTPQTIARPEHYDERRYWAATTATRTEFTAMHWPATAMKPFAPAWRDTALPNGPYTDGPTVYHHRRLVDRRHLNLPRGSETVLVNWPLQDYPTNRFPQHVVEALEAIEPGAASKTLPEMTPRQRRVVFDDAKRHALGLLHHLQTTVADRDLAAAAGKPIVTFRDLELTDEFGTADRLPPKPYVREGLRTDCLYMVREQDVRDTDGVQAWAEFMPADGVFGYQFNIDFHPTKRIFQNDDPRGPWTLVHTKFRNWSTDTDRSMLPLRSLVPRSIDGLIVAGKNLGVSSIVQSAVRLHGHGMLAGQAAGTAAAVCLEGNHKPRGVAADLRFGREVQRRLLEPQDVVTKSKPPGVLLWPYHDVPPDADYFAATNRAALSGLYVVVDGAPDFAAGKHVTPQEFQACFDKAARLMESCRGREPRAIEDPKMFRLWRTLNFQSNGAAPPNFTRRDLVLLIDEILKALETDHRPDDALIAAPTMVSLVPHPAAVANHHPPGEVDLAELVPFIVADPKSLPGIVVDDAQAELVGRWQYSTHTPPYVGLGYLHDMKEGKGTKSATFRPDLPRAGRYEVRLAHCYNVRRAVNAPITIHHADGETTMHVDMQQPSPIDRLFLSLGTFRFEAGRGGWVRVGNEGTDGAKVVIADAVQWLPVESRD